MLELYHDHQIRSGGLGTVYQTDEDTVSDEFPKECVCQHEIQTPQESLSLLPLSCRLIRSSVAVKRASWIVLRKPLYDSESFRILGSGDQASVASLLGHTTPQDCSRSRRAKQSTSHAPPQWRFRSCIMASPLS